MSESLKLQEYKISDINDMFLLLDMIGRQSSRYYFRGQSSKYERLITNIERKAEKNNVPHNMLNRYELNIINSYKQQIHNYLNTVPVLDSYIDWLSIIQHYGGPTRMLDFTSSIFTALYFSIQDNEEDAFIYLFRDFNYTLLKIESEHRDELSRVINNIDKFDIVKNSDGNNTWWQKFHRTNTITDDEEFFGINKDFTNHVMHGDIEFPGVFLIKPFFLNKRIIAQQGLFAVPFSLNYSFEDNLKAMFDKNYDFEKITV